MRVAVIGSRSMMVDDLERYMPEDVTMIISGGAKGVDECARVYAMGKEIPLEEYFPEYEKYGRNAPLKRNEIIVARAEYVLAFWDGRSHGTAHVIGFCKAKNIPCRIIET